MSNETDLDWLARNVHVWHEEHHRLGVVGRGNGYPDPYFMPPEHTSFHGFTRGQWLARRAELQNKPSWKDAPEWAGWLAQDASGWWWFFRYEPEVAVSVWDSDNPAFHHSSWIAGEILGDWRETLELRPEEFNPSIEEAKKLAQEFKLITSIEDNQEQDMKQDNGWYERGELPPVGVVCEAYIDYPPQWVEAEIVAHKDGFAIGWCKSVMKGCHGDKASEFRPIRTEREAAIDRMQSDISERWANCEELARHLVDKGWVKGGK